jgi:hypothetical protein
MKIITQRDHIRKEFDWFMTRPRLAEKLASLNRETVTLEELYAAVHPETYPWKVPLTCDECGKVADLMQIGGQFAVGDENTAYLCLECLGEAYRKLVTLEIDNLPE